jgi:hypothetical protein
MFSRAAMLCAIALALTAPPALAHHSYAMFDRAKTIALSGTVKQFQWTNPHSWIQVVVPGDSGPEEWSVEMGSPFELTRVGWNASMLKPGDRVVIQVHPTKDGTKGGGFVSATDADGQPIGRPK